MRTLAQAPHVDRFRTEAGGLAPHSNSANPHNLSRPIARSRHAPMTASGTGGCLAGAAALPTLHRQEG